MTAGGNSRNSGWLRRGASLSRTRVGDLASRDSGTIGVTSDRKSGARRAGPGAGSVGAGPPSRGGENSEDGTAQHHRGIKRGARDEQAQSAANFQESDSDAQELPERGHAEGLDHDVGAEQLGPAGADVDQAEGSLNAVESRDRHRRTPFSAAGLVERSPIPLRRTMVRALGLGL